MKKVIYLSAIIAILGLASCKSGKQTSLKLENSIDTVSYILGADIAHSLKENGIEVNLEKFVAGFENKINDTDTIFTAEEIRTIMTKFQQNLQQKQEETMKQESENNKMKGEEFLATNKTQAGIKTTASGLQYKVIREGSGPKPTATSNVTVHYEGKLIDGSIFDSSYERGEPITFGLNQVIPGWTEGLQLMNSGSEYQLFIPSDLGYGDRNIAGIPGGSVLIFKVELLSFE